MLKGTIIETILREAVAICCDEFLKRSSRNSQASPTTITVKMPEQTKAEEPGRPRLIRVKDWPKIHGYPKEGGLRSLVFHAQQNGFESCIRRIGRSVFIQEDEFFKWVDKQNKLS